MIPVVLVFILIMHNVCSIHLSIYVCLGIPISHALIHAILDVTIYSSCKFVHIMFVHILSSCAQQAQHTISKYIKS